MDIIDVVIIFFWLLFAGYFIYLYTRYFLDKEVLIKQAWDFVNLPSHIRLMLSALKTTLRNKRVILVILIVCLISIDNFVGSRAPFWNLDRLLYTGQTQFTFLSNLQMPAPSPFLNIAVNSIANINEVVKPAQYNKLLVILVNLALLGAIPFILKKLHHLKKRLDVRLINSRRIFFLIVEFLALMSLMITLIYIITHPFSYSWEEIFPFIYPFWITSLAITETLIIFLVINFCKSATCRDNSFKPRFWKIVLRFGPAIFIFAFLFEFVQDFEYWIILIGYYVGIDLNLYVPAASTTVTIIRFIRLIAMLGFFFYPFSVIINRRNVRRALSENFRFIGKYFGRFAGLLIAFYALFFIMNTAFHFIYVLASHTRTLLYILHAVENAFTVFISLVFYMIITTFFIKSTPP